MKGFLEFIAEVVVPVSLIGLLVMLLVGGPIAGILWFFDDSAEQKAAFMGDCLQHRQQYECTAMWRAGESHTSVVPVPVVVGR